MAGSDLEQPAAPRLVRFQAVGGRWLRLDSHGGSVLVRAEPGLKLDYDRGGVRVAARDGRELVFSGVAEGQFDAFLRLVMTVSNGCGSR